MRNKFSFLILSLFFSLASFTLVVTFLVQENVRKEQMNERYRKNDKVALSYDYPVRLHTSHDREVIANNKKSQPVDIQGAVLSAFDERGALIDDITFKTIPDKTVTGTLRIAWGDRSDLQGEPVEMYMLESDKGGTLYLDVSDEILESSGGASRLQDERVTVTGDKYVGEFLSSGDTLSFLEVSEIILDQEVTAADRPIYQSPLEGSQNWFTIPCKFADKPQEPTEVSYFDTLMSNDYPYLDHYWREVSYGKIDLLGSSAASAWYSLPDNRAAYFYYWGSQQWLDTAKVAQDCFDSYSGVVDLSLFKGLHFMINYDIGLYAWGGSFGIDTDGDGTPDKAYMGTILDPSDYMQRKVVAHEMGHGFALRHSIGGGAYPQYGSKWDVMSGGNQIHTISYGKYRRAWISQDEAYVPALNSTQTIILERLALPYREEGTYLMAIIPFKDSEYEYYTVEVRLSYGYDANGLPGEGVVIHRVHDYDERASVIDKDGDGDVNDEGGVWTAGETFIDTINDISIHIVDTGPPPDRGEVKNMEVEITRGNMTDLSVSMTDSPDPSLVTDIIVYDVSVTNLGPDNASGVVTTSELPLNIEIVSIPTYCSERTDTSHNYVDCNLDLLMGPQTVDSVKTTIKEIGQDSFDTNLDVNGDSQINSFDYGAVSFRYLLTKNTTYISDSMDSLDTNEIIASGQTVSYGIQMRPQQVGVITHTVSVSGDEMDTDQSNNSYTEETTVTDISDIIPTMVYPEDGQALDLGGSYMFKVFSIQGAEGYEFKLYQDDVFVNTSYYQSANSEFAIHPDNAHHKQFHEGEVEVRIRVRLSDVWTQERIITIILIDDTQLETPVWVAPTQGQKVAMNGCYTLKVEPVPGADGYLFGIFQDGVMVYENWRDKGQLSSDGTWEVFFNSDKYHEGDVDIWARVWIGGEWTPEAIVTVYLDPNVPPSCR